MESQYFCDVNIRYFDGELEYDKVFNLFFEVCNKGHFKDITITTEESEIFSRMMKNMYSNIPFDDSILDNTNRLLDATFCLLNNELKCVEEDGLELIYRRAILRSVFLRMIGWF